MFGPFTLEFKELKKYFTDGLYKRDHSNANMKKIIRTLENGTYIISFLFYFGIEYSTLRHKVDLYY
jgi:hypothetical protein